MPIYDISPEIGPTLAVWPGDTPPSREVLLDLARGDNITLSTLHATVHLGAHADAPSHYGRGGASIEQRSLEPYLGPCAVVRVAAQRARQIGADELFTSLRRALQSPFGAGPPTEQAKIPPRVLIATGTFPNPRRFSPDFAALAPEAIDALHERGVRLVGIDTPSVDLFDSKDLPAHRRFLLHDMAILEGLLLESVPEGVYELIALPLRLAGFDASPVRAVLRTIDAGAAG